MARQRMGQHFLRDLGWRKRILRTLPLGAADTWIEIGAGHGEMTELLAAAGRRVIAIEGDPQLADRPARKCGRGAWAVAWSGSSFRRRAHAGFGEDCWRRTISCLRKPSLLYHLADSAPALRCADLIDSIHIVIQLEVAERIVARPGRREYGYLSVACQFYSAPKIALRLPPGAFRPPPKVESALVAMTLPGERAQMGIHGASNETRFLEFVQACFSQKRKTLRNNLRKTASDERIHAALAALGLRSDARAEQVALAQFAGLFGGLLG